jgi:type I restriction enzyme S subunit
MKWPTESLGSLCDVMSGGTPKRTVDEYWNGEIPWVKISDMLQGEIKHTDESITDKGLRESPARLLETGTLLLSIFATVGRTAVLAIPAATNQAIVGLRIKAENLDQRYLRHYLDSQAEALKSKSRGVAQDNINTSILKNLRIPLPPLEEQRRIAAILDKASRIAELCGTALKLSHAADKSLFLHFFADLPEESDLLLLEELADKRSNAIRTGPFGSQLLHGEFTDSGVAVLGIDNAVNNSFEWSKRRFISHEKYEQLKRYTVYPGDLLITIMGTCGRAAVVPDDIPQAINTKHLCAISVDRSVVLPEYLHSYILFHPSASRYLSQRTKGAIMEGLNMTIIKELPVAVPPVSHQMAWLARRKILRAASKRAQSMSASALSLRQSFSYNLLEERGA